MKPSSEHLALLKVLLQKENPALFARLMQCEMEDNKRIMCCLIALGLDDVDMMARAACLSPHSVKAYRKECKGVVSKAKNTSTVGVDNDDGKKYHS